jgi:cysteine synthase A
MEDKRTVLDLIGKTPILLLHRIVPKESARVFVKLEYFNPGGSVKDRIARNMVEDAERRGALKPGATIVEPTSGNTGIGLALVAAVKGYRLILTMPEGMSLERRSVLQAFGAEVILTPADRGMVDAVEKAQEIVSQHSNYFIPLQFENPANPEIHRKTTGPEILEGMGERPVDAFVAGVGTGGTITGVGEVLKAKNSSTKIVAVEPKSSSVLSGGRPGPHRIQGIGAGFVPKVLNTQIIDEVIAVTDEDAYHTAKRMAHVEGLLIGISAGAAIWAALKVAERLGAGKNVVTIVPDSGERYPSMGRFFE